MSPRGLAAARRPRRSRRCEALVAEALPGIERRGASRREQATWLMPRKAPDLAQLARTLKAPSFSHAAASADQAVLEPVSPTTLVLRVDEIKAYEHNPRHAENREYPRLKDSIRARRGLTTPLTVTKRPGDDLYTIAAGGNSRLRALKELARRDARRSVCVRHVSL